MNQHHSGYNEIGKRRHGEKRPTLADNPSRHAVTELCGIQRRVVGHAGRQIARIETVTGPRRIDDVMNRLRGVSLDPDVVDALARVLEKKGAFAEAAPSRAVPLAS